VIIMGYGDGDGDGDGDGYGYGYGDDDGYGKSDDAMADIQHNKSLIKYS
jgi:hypothetical protein